MFSGLTKRLEAMTKVLFPSDLVIGLRSWFKKPVNGELKCRLDRMERRMSLLKQKDDTPESPHRSPQVTGTNVHQNARTPQSESKINTERGVKRKTGLEPQSLNKRFAAEPHKQTHKNEKSERHEKQTQRRHQKSCTVTSSSEEENQDVITFKKDNKKLKQKQIVDNSCLRTDESYYVSFYKPISDEIDTMSRGDILKQAEGQLEVEVPTWKIQKYNKLWVMEGTENLEDEIFIKRHQKPEVEEKRRKRWDLQRMREQSIYQKLKDKEEKCPEGEESDRMQSFYPLLDDITHIEVCDEIPVMAFGHTLPNIESNHFSLPWELEVSRQRSHSSRSANTRSSRNK